MDTCVVTSVLGKTAGAVVKSRRRPGNHPRLGCGVPTLRRCVSTQSHEMQWMRSSAGQRQGWEKALSWGRHWVLEPGGRLEPGA